MLDSTFPVKSSIFLQNDIGQNGVVFGRLRINVTYFKSERGDGGKPPALQESLRQHRTSATIRIIRQVLNP